MWECYGRVRGRTNEYRYSLFIGRTRSWAYGGCARLKAETGWVDGEGEGSIDLLFQEEKLWPFFAFNERGRVGGRWGTRPQVELRLGYQTFQQ